MTQIVMKVRDKTASLELDNIIHQGAWSEVLKLIDQHINLEQNYDPFQKFERHYKSISINGERGAGKTSFLLTLRDYLGQKIKDSDSTKFEQIVTLPIIDPTLISTKQHILLLIITAIKEEVNNKFQNSCEKKNDVLYKRDYWLDSLKKLAEGLNQIDNIGPNPLSYELWDDAGLVIEKGLEIAKVGLEFEKNFHEFVAESLNILNKVAFVLFLDDIDTDFSKGWQVLETLRKYITTPQIITIMAGNYSLYESLVRENRWKLFEGLLKFEKKNKKKLTQDVDKLTQQYLMKILQPGNIINLHKFSYYIFYQDKYEILVDFGGE